MTEPEKAKEDAVEVKADEDTKGVDAEKAAEEAEEGDTFDAEITDGKRPPKTTREQRERTSNTLSVISKKYDLDGDGKLDETEKMMRAYDTNSDGQLDMQEIHKIVRDLQAQQRELDHERKTILNMKRVIIFLVVFTVILALAMLGVSFAAARLAKDTSVTGNAALADKAGNEELSTVGSSRVDRFKMAANETEEPARRLFGSINSFAGMEMRRRLNEQHEEEHGRKLFPCMKGSCRHSGDNDNSDRDADADYDRNRNNDGWNNGRDDERLNPRDWNMNYNYNDWNECKYFEGTLDFYEFDRIRTSAGRGESSVVLNYEYGRSSFSKRIYTDSVFIDGREDFVVIESGGDLDCGVDRCANFKSVYIFENCRSYGGGNRNYDNGRYRDDYDGYDNYISNGECDLYTCQLGIQRGSSNGRDWN